MRTIIWPHAMHTFVLMPCPQSLFWPPHAMHTTICSPHVMCTIICSHAMHTIICSPHAMCSDLTSHAMRTMTWPPNSMHIITWPHHAMHTITDLPKPCAQSLTHAHIHWLPMSCTQWLDRWSVPDIVGSPPAGLVIVRWSRMLLWTWRWKGSSDRCRCRNITA